MAESEAYSSKRTLTHASLLINLHKDGIEGKRATVPVATPTDDEVGLQRVPISVSVASRTLKSKDTYFCKPNYVVRRM